MAEARNKNRLRKRIYGAAFYGASGGSIPGGLALLDKLGDSAEVNLPDTGETPSGARSAMAAGLGLPIAFKHAGGAAAGRPKDVRDNAACEPFARTASAAYGGAGFPAWLPEYAQDRFCPWTAQPFDYCETGPAVRR